MSTTRQDVTIHGEVTDASIQYHALRAATQFAETSQEQINALTALDDFYSLHPEFVR